MEKLIICEGRIDSLFLTALLKKEFKITATKIKFSELQLNDPPQGSTVVILDCNGLGNILKALEKINAAAPLFLYYKVPKLIIWDQDPGNKESKRTRDRCRKKIDTENGPQIAENYDTPFTIKPMLEGLIIKYLREQIKQNGQKNGEDKAKFSKKELEKSMKCMDAYLKCLSSKKNHAIKWPSSEKNHPMRCLLSKKSHSMKCPSLEKNHPKIRIDLLERGIFLQIHSDVSRQNDSSIIPGIFNHIDFGSDCFKKLREALEKFISDTESMSKPC